MTATKEQVEAAALVMINEQRAYHNMDPLKWNDPCLKRDRPVFFARAKAALNAALSLSPPADRGSVETVLREAVTEAVTTTVEECAKVAESVRWNAWEYDDNGYVKHVPTLIAERIRSLASKPAIEDDGEPR